MLRWIGKRLALRAYRQKLGRALVERYGGEAQYTVSQVRVTAERLAINLAYIDYAYAAYCGRKLYEAYHAELGVPGDWAARRAEIGSVHLDLGGTPAAAITRASGARHTVGSMMPGWTPTRTGSGSAKRSRRSSTSSAAAGPSSS